MKLLLTVPVGLSSKSCVASYPRSTAKSCITSRTTLEELVLSLKIDNLVATMGCELIWRVDEDGDIENRIKKRYKGNGRVKSQEG